MKGWIAENTRTALDASVTWLTDNFLTGLAFIAKQVYAYSDVALLVSIVFLLLAMFGSKKAANGIYWTFASYIIIQILGGIL